MAASIVPGQRTWKLSRDNEGHREYTITHLVRAAILDGPQVVMNTPGLPAIGSIWNFDNDLDVWAFCTGKMLVDPLVKKEPNRDWEVAQKFSTLPRKRCADESIEDPLLEPDRISGSFVKYTKEAVKDRNGALIKSSSHELFRGPAVEFDHNRPTVQIGQNILSLELEVFTEMVDTVNDAPLWGLGTRKVKLSNVSWERLLFGACDFYYTRNLEFDIDFNTFDRDILDEGTKVLRGHHESCGTTGTGTGTSGDSSAWILDGEPNPDNPLDFIRYKDCNDENARTLLDGQGKPLEIGASPVFRDTEFYPESNFLLLAVPVVLSV